MKADRLLTEMFLSEANIEVPDEEMASLKRVVSSAARIGRLPANSPSWIVDRAPKARRASDASAAPARSRGSVPPPVSSEMTPDSRSGRVIPSTNRFRQQEPGPESQGAPVQAAPKATPEKPSGPGLIKRAFSALRGRDPENNLPVPKSANTKLRGKPGKASLPDLGRFFNSSPSAQGSHAAPTGAGAEDPLAAYPNKTPEQPAAIDADSDDDRVLSKGWGSADDGEDDPTVKNMARSLGRFKAKEKAPESNDGFEGDEKTDVDAKPAPKAKAQHPSKSGGEKRKKESLTLLRQMIVDRDHRRN